jgi:hypothetical protein
MPEVDVAGRLSYRCPHPVWPSTALNGAYSYPDITTLTALSAPQKGRLRTIEPSPRTKEQGRRFVNWRPSSLSCKHLAGGLSLARAWADQ